MNLADSPRIAVFAILFLLGSKSVGFCQASANSDPEYVRVTNERAQKIVSKIDIQDAEKVSRVREAVANFYRELSAIHENRKTKLKQIDASATDAATTIRSESDLLQFRLHYAFLAKLAAELSADDIDKIKNGLTYDVVPKTYQQYLLLYPNLASDQQRMVHMLLLEAREHAMDAGTSDEKHGVFGKYKGRINNYLSAQGYDAKQAERDLKARQEKSK